MRLFIAISPDDHLRGQLLQIVDSLRRGAVSGRFVSPELMHVTLVFLGEQPDARAATAALEQLRGDGFSLQLDRLGRFRREGGDIWWLGVAPSPPLQALHRRLTGLLEQQGFLPERRAFRPHLTLGRQVLLPPDFSPQQPQPLHLEARAVSLMESRRENGRLRYIERFSQPLCINKKGGEPHDR